MTKIVNSEIIVIASAELQENIIAELEIEDNEQGIEELMKDVEQPTR